MAHKCDGCKHKGEHREMMFRPMDVCNRGVNLLEAIQNYEAERCPYQKTNADRIRSMSDEDLAVYWANNHDNFCQNKPECGEALDTEDMIPEEWCVACALEWLQRPAEER